MDQSQTGEPVKSGIDQGKVRGGAATRTSSVALVGRVPSTTDVGDWGTREGEQLRCLRDQKIKAGGWGVGCLLQGSDSSQWNGIDSVLES
jgi:hypothetical protein